MRHAEYTRNFRDAAGNICCTMSQGGKSANGAHNFGTVFELTPPTRKHGKYKETVLWAFNYSDGLNPASGPVLNGAGNLDGTTGGGGEYQVGVVYEVTP